LLLEFATRGSYRHDARQKIRHCRGPEHIGGALMPYNVQVFEFFSPTDGHRSFGHGARRLRLFGKLIDGGLSAVVPRCHGLRLGAA
jgi:hypothetical protein